MSSWIPYVVRQGDHLSKLAARHSFDADTVWQDARNADLRNQRPDPHILCAGDILYIPEAQPQWLAVSVGAVNKFHVTVPTVKVSLVCAQDDKPIANAACVIHGLPTPLQLTTDGNGLLEFDVPASVASVTLEIPSRAIVKKLQVGHLDPVDQPSGVAQRLRNLGYTSAAAAARDPDAAQAQAVKAFQADEGLPVTGELDDQTIQRLKSVHKC